MAQRSRHSLTALGCALVLLPGCTKHKAAQTWARAGILAQWVAVQPYADTSSALLCANWSRNEWHVFPRGDSVYVRRHERSDGYDSMPLGSSGVASYRTPFRAVAVANGWLAGYNHGEFGGSIWWFAPDGRDSAKVSDEQIVAFVKMRAGLIGVSGLNHMDIHEGRVVTLIQDQTGRWKATPILELGDGPETVVLESDTALLIVGSSQLMRAHLNQATSNAHLERLITGRSWGLLYPSSAVRDPSGVVYVGMRHAVMRLAPRKSGYDELWLIPPQCQTVEQDTSFDSAGRYRKDECRCTANSP
jgi:hypothetical protein